MDEFDSNEDIVNIENGLLNIHARELKEVSVSSASSARRLYCNADFWLYSIKE
jgi:hypothetical protein